MSEKSKLENLLVNELLLKKKSLQNRQKLFIIVAAILVLSTFYNIYTKTGSMHPFLILGSLFLLIYNGSELKKVEEEINNRNK